NELMGLYRKLGKQEQALAQVAAALEKIEGMGVGEQVGAATTYLNGATVYKAFGLAEEAIPLFERARAIYERELPPQDSRLGGLYNNMGLALVDLKRFAEADALYRKAIAVMQTAQSGALEVAITYLNMATAAEAELGLWEADEKIADYLKKAEDLLNGHQNRDGYYAFVCEKCASVYGYYGYFNFEKELTERARRIYEGA
ncbi:MAG: tetratricopeptide repeat protein, partial [Clostridia bacterium]|nr:tetratricopeptide repeat protein [Clostridia bacterium]